MKSKEDPRVRKTRRLLRDALVSLILDKDMPLSPSKKLQSAPMWRTSPSFGISIALTSC